MSTNYAATRNLLFGLLAGSIIGVTVGVLYAPKKGKRLRADISRKAGEIVDDVEDMLDETGSKTSEFIGRARKRADDFVGTAQKKASTMVEGASKIVSRS